MNYSALIKGLVAEMKQGKRLAKMSTPVKIILIIILIPFIVGFALSKFAYAVTLFFYKMISAPAEYLQNWLTSQKDGVQHATQAVMYAVCLPTIFGLQVMLSFNAFAFYFQWFFLQIQAYIVTLGGITWQPYITDAKFEA